ncbi:MAG: polysaccharide deacetylase family protein [Firmicutes bacterium]|nr:polysaccharide deacetylase family protein [Bacillota bacterium]
MLEVLLSILLACTTALSGCTPTAGSEVSVPILMYHHVTEEGGTYAVTPDKLRQDFEDLLDEGYTTVFFEDLVNYTEGEGVLPAKPIVITFDDGYQSNYDLALPLLEELDMKAEISVVASALNDGRWTFDWEEARELEASGHVKLQSHTYDLHEYKEDGRVKRYGVLQAKGESAKAWEKVFRGDVQAVEDHFLKELGHAPLVYTYPYGALNRKTEKILKENGYKVTLTVEKGVNKIRVGKPGDLYEMYRIGADNYEGNIVELIETHR